MTKKIYAAPSIERKIAGAPDKFASGITQFQDEIEGIPTKKLIEKYGSPLFVFSEKVMRRKNKEAFREVSLQYPNVKFAWSYKTNYLEAICAIFHQEGAWAEVVSGMEYERARLLGMPGKKIIFNGPGKTREQLSQVIQDGAMINIDHLMNYFYLRKQLRKPARILRLVSA
jgi:diaminopimelate decarboxylase